MNQSDQDQIADGGVQDNVYTGVYRSLFFGMLIGTISFGIGVVLALLRPGGEALTMNAARLPHLGGLAHGLVSLDPIAFMLLGTVVTIFTPLTRVVVSLVAFLVDRDYTFVWITALVLAAAAASVALGWSGLAR
jgi:uncharacterized membrane protein